jgi:hypothetical protein
MTAGAQIVHWRKTFRRSSFQQKRFRPSPYQLLPLLSHSRWRALRRLRPN